MAVARSRSCHIVVAIAVERQRRSRHKFRMVTYKLLLGNIRFGGTSMSSKNSRRTFKYY